MSKPIPTESDILIVEDSPTQAAQLQAMLEHHGFPSRVATHGQQALAVLAERKPLLVISDITMPGMDGYELCRRIRADPTLASLPVILLTSLSDPADVIRGLESGADNFVIKPPDESYLLSRVRYIMANQHLRPLEATQISLEIQLGGHRHKINADRLQMLHLLLSTYESAVQRGRELEMARQELRTAYDQLEEKVRIRTEDLRQEIAERGRLHGELQRSEEKYRQIFASSPMPMWVFALDSLRFLEVNEAAVRHYGYERDEFLQMTIADIRPPGELDALHRDLAGRPPNLRVGTWKHRKKNGEVIDVEITGHELMFGGCPARLILAHDVTARHRAEAARLWSEARFAAIFSAAPVGIWIGTPDGKLLDANPEACRVLGYSREELIGAGAPEREIWLDPGAADAFKEGRNTVRNQEVRIRRKSGEVRTLLISLEPLALGTEEMVLALFVDVTERKLLEDELQRAQREESIGRLAGGIAHDMNNILAPILMTAGLLRRLSREPEVEKYLATIESCAERGAALVRQLLTFGRGREGERQRVHVPEIVDEVVSMLRETFPRNITIKTESSDGLNVVDADPTQLHQVILNLCVNARDAMPAGGTLTISVRNTELNERDAALHPQARVGRYLQIRVADSGTGIPFEIANRIFDPFFTTKGIGKGTGLGLSLVAGIVKSHGGFVLVSSEPGRGAVFDINLPVHDGGGESTGPAAACEEAPPGRGETILVVDDEENIRTVVRDALLRHNYQVLTAPDGVAAAAICTATPAIRLVVTDLDMPVMDGIGLARVLRRLSPNVRIIISTGMDDRSRASRRQDELDALGVSAILLKPFAPEELLRTVHAALQTEDAAPPA